MVQRLLLEVLVQPIQLLGLQLQNMMVLVSLVDVHDVLVFYPLPHKRLAYLVVRHGMRDVREHHREIRVRRRILIEVLNISILSDPEYSNENYQHDVG